MLQACLLSASGNNNQEVKMYKTVTVHEARESELKGHSDKAGISETVGCRVLRLTIHARRQRASDPKPEL